MTYIKGDNPTTSESDAIEKVAEWIDTYAIADTIAEALADEELEPTPTLMKLVWLNFLETELSEGLEQVIRYGNLAGG